MDRDLFNEAHGQRISPPVAVKAGDPRPSGAENRLFVEAVLSLVRAGTPWRDLPPRFGKWGTVCKRFRGWAEKGMFERTFEVVSGAPDFEYALIYGTIVKVHRHRGGARGRTQNQAIDKSRGGLATKIVSLVANALGNLVRYALLAGKHHYSIGVEPLLYGIALDALIAEKALDRDWLRAELNEHDALAVIPPNGSRAGTIAYFKDM